jgi:TetR/AcrR family transcriptional regulator, transcriptional repressor of bet genes
MARPRADDVRRKILLATFAQIASRGVDGMSMRTLAAAAGASVGTVTYYFPSKRQLLHEAIRYGYERPPANFVHGDPLASMYALLERFDLTAPHRRTWWQFWIAIIAYSQKDDEIRQLLADQHHSAVGRFRKLIADGIASGIFHTDEVDAFAVKIAAHAHGIAVAQLVDPPSAEALSRDLPALIDPIRVASRRT